MPAPAPENATAQKAALAAIAGRDHAGFLRAYGQMKTPVLMPLLLCAAEAGGEETTGFLIVEARQKMEKEEWLEAANRALENAIKGRHVSVVTQLLEAGAPASARFAWVAAARSGYIDMLEILQKAAKDESFGVEAGRLRAAFNTAAVAGQEKVSLWMLDTFKGRIGIKDLTEATRYAMQEGQTATALFLAKRAEEYAPVKSRERELVQNKLLTKALETNSLELVDHFFGRTQHGYANCLATAARANAAHSFAYIIEKAAQAGYEIPETDIITPMMIAADHGSADVMEYLIEKTSVNIHAHDEGTLRKAMDHYARDGFAPVEKLLRKGASPFYAKKRAVEKFPQDDVLQDRIAAVAADLRTDADVNYRAHVENLSAENLLRHDDVLGMTPLHFAAANGFFAKVQAAAGKDLAAEDYLSKSPRGETLLGVLVRTGQLGEVFTPALWTGQAGKAATVLAKLSEKSLEDFPAGDFLRGTEILTLRQKARAHGLKLKP